MDIAKELDINVIAVITKSDFDADVEGFEIVVAPKKYVTVLDSLTYYLEEATERVIAEKFSYMLRTEDYLSTLMYFRGFEFERAVAVLDTESLKGILILDGEKSGVWKAIEECSERVDPEAFKAALMVSLNIANKGREGRKVGTAFIMGDAEEVLKRSTQIILNPYEGHSERERDLKNPENWESIMEFAQLDGVFVIDERGIIVAAGRYIEASARDLNLRFKMGLGGRHIACASITKETKAIAIVVSESGGDITVFKDGIEILNVPSILF
jgi:DNA integrity scanning protein DisA with diadenylate cyclase activity